MQEEFNFFSEEQTKITVESFKELCTEIFNKRAEVEEYDKTLSALKADLESLKIKALSYLQENGLSKFHVPGIGTIGTRNIESVKIEDKDAFVAHLKERGLESLLSINHQTLQAQYRDWSEKAKEEGIFELAVPGLSKPTIFTNITMNKGK